MRSAFLASFRTPETAFLALFALLLPLSKSAVTVLIGCASVALLYRIARDRPFRKEAKRRLVQPLLVPVMLPVLVGTAGLLVTSNLADGLGVLGKLATLPLAYLVIAVLTDAAEGGPQGSGTAKHILLLFIAGVLILDIIALLTYLGFIGQKRFILPVAPLHVHHIWFANLNAVAVYAVLSFLLFGKGTQGRVLHAFFAVVLGLATFAILFSLSRTAWLGLIAAGVVMSYLLSPAKRWFFLALAVAVAGGILAYQFSTIVQSRINGIFTDIELYRQGNTASNVGDRFVMWDAAFRMFLSNPLVGVGTGDYMATMRDYVAAGAVPARILEYNQPHNMYLFAMATNGLLGLAALFVLFLRALSLSLPIRNMQTDQAQFRFLAAAVAVHYLVAGLTDSLFNIFLLRYAFAFVIGLCFRNGLRPSLEGQVKRVTS